jgi:hypothetical protein
MCTHPSTLQPLGLSLLSVTLYMLFLLLEMVYLLGKEVSSVTSLWAFPELGTLPLGPHGSTVSKHSQPGQATS